jgi:hypothetical protein
MLQKCTRKSNNKRESFSKFLVFIIQMPDQQLFQTLFTVAKIYLKLTIIQGKNIYKELKVIKDNEF